MLRLHIQYGDFARYHYTAASLGTSCCAAVLQVSTEALKKTCPIPFDEGRLWKGANAAELRQDLQKHFQNITRVMDCVGCEKCKLWGKLQILGGHLGHILWFDVPSPNWQANPPEIVVAEMASPCYIMNIYNRH